MELTTKAGYEYGGPSPGWTMKLPIATRAASEPARATTIARERFTAFLADETSEQVVRQCVQEMALPNSSVHRGNMARVITHLQSVRSPNALMVDGHVEVFHFNPHEPATSMTDLLRKNINVNLSNP